MHLFSNSVMDVVLKHWRINTKWFFTYVIKLDLLLFYLLPSLTWYPCKTKNVNLPVFCSECDVSHVNK